MASYLVKYGYCFKFTNSDRNAGVSSNVRKFR